MATGVEVASDGLFICWLVVDIRAELGQGQLVGALGLIEKALLLVENGNVVLGLFHPQAGPHVLLVEQGVQLGQAVHDLLYRLKVKHLA